MTLATISERIGISAVTKLQDPEVLLARLRLALKKAETLQMPKMADALRTAISEAEETISQRLRTLL